MLRSRIISSYIRFIERHSKNVNANELLSLANIERYQAKDEDHWFSQEQVDLFHEKLVKLTKNQNISREAGRYAVSTDALGVVKSYALGFITSAKVCEIIGKAANKMVRSCVWEARRLGPNKMQITATPRPGTNEKPFQCENRMGYLESIFALFKHKLPKIEHTECVFDGDASCRYTITWHTFRSDVWKTTRNYLALSLSVVTLGLLHFYTQHVWALGWLFLLSRSLFFPIRSGTWKKKSCLRPCRI
jgi:hypothetical protein